MNLLYENGADPIITNQQGKQPMHSAAENGNVEAIRWLLIRGATVNATGEAERDRRNRNSGIGLAQGEQPIHLAASHGYVDVVPTG